MVISFPIRAAPAIDKMLLSLAENEKHCIDCAEAATGPNQIPNYMVEVFGLLGKLWVLNYKMLGMR